MPITELQKQSSNNNLLTRDLKRVTVWRGDHSGCQPGHRDGLCSSINAWRLDGDAKIVVSKADRPTNRRFHSMVKYSNASEREPEMAWKAKGWRDIAEAEGVRPIPEVVEKMRERAAEELERGMQFKKFDFAQIVKEKSGFLAKFDAINRDFKVPGEPAAPVPDGAAGGSGGFVGTQPPKKGRASG